MTERTGYRLRKVKCKFKPNLALAWRTSTDPVVLWLSSFVAVPCLINRTRCILPTPPILLTLPPHTHTQGGMCGHSLFMFCFIEPSLWDLGPGLHGDDQAILWVRLGSASVSEVPALSPLSPSPPSWRPSVPPAWVLQ